MAEIINEELNVLSLEDSDADFEIICYQLTDAGYHLNISRVDKKNEFESLLRSNTYDVILADFNLPGFDAFGALHLCSEICPSIPFICVSGSIGEETAIELLKLGAVDYVLKDRPERLPFAIKRALKEAKEKETLRKTELQLQKLSRAVEQSPNIIFITDTDGIIEYVNPTTYKSTGYTSEDLIGQNPRIFSSGETPRGEYVKLWESIKSGNDWNGEFLNKKKNGELYWEAASISPILNNKGVIINFLAVKKDITQDKIILNELIEAKEHAEESDRLKSAFLANISHEIRTPMNGILGFAELLKMPELTPDVQEGYIHIIEQSGKRMLNIINDIVDISKIEAGQMNIHLEEVDVNQLLRDLMVFFAPEANSKGIRISLKNDLADENCMIQTDHTKLAQILSNLIKNAIKFTQEGSIEFGYRVVGASHALSLPKHSLSLQFFVRDTGVGIPDDQINVIFERFRQGSVSLTRAYEGAGLGLSISKAFVEMLEGQIEVKSEVGKGSVFQFQLPYHSVDSVLPQANESKASSIHPKPFHVLIAEDDETSLIYIKAILENENIILFEAVNGLQAVESVKKYPEIELVLMDMKMPQMDGYEATRQIKKLRPTLQVIAQTAYSFAEEKEKAEQAGCDEYLSKPIRKQILLEIIQKYGSSQS